MSNVITLPRLSDVYDARRSIFVKHHARNVDASFADGELRTAVTPYHLAKLIYRRALEIDEREITAIYEITDDQADGGELSISNITKDVFALAESGHFDRFDPEGEGQKEGWDRSKEARLARAL